jgi:hypothetical protein
LRYLSQKAAQQVVPVNSEQEALDEPAGDLPFGAEKAESWVFGLKTGIVGLL